MTSIYFSYRATLCKRRTRIRSSELRQNRGNIERTLIYYIMLQWGSILSRKKVTYPHNITSNAGLAHHHVVDGTERLTWFIALDCNNCRKQSRRSYTSHNAQ